MEKEKKEGFDFSKAVDLKSKLTLLLKADSEVLNWLSANMDNWTRLYSEGSQLAAKNVESEKRLKETEDNLAKIKAQIKKEQQESMDKINEERKKIEIQKEMASAELKAAQNMAIEAKNKMAEVEKAKSEFNARVKAYEERNAKIAALVK